MVTYSAIGLPFARDVFRQTAFRSQIEAHRSGPFVRFLIPDAEDFEVDWLLGVRNTINGSHFMSNFFSFQFSILTFPPPALPSSGPDELPLFLEGDEELTTLAKESAGAAQGLATQLSTVRRSHMACWGIDASSSGESAAVAATDDDEEGAVAAREHGSCMGWWSGVLGRWHERTQLVDPSLQKKFRVVNQGPWAQVTASLADRERTNRRAFMTESEVGADCIQTFWSTTVVCDVLAPETSRLLYGRFILLDFGSC